ncbi:MAG: porin family protein [Alphaproteobacteria bacterium]|nr:porin family protein [Alphaproteobacteria bacterium]
MKKIILSLALIGIAVSANAARYDNYLSLKVGYVWGDVTDYPDSIDGVGARLAIGQNYRTNDWLSVRGEVEAGYHSQKEGILSVRPISALINLYADFGPRAWLAKPYIGAGIGGAYITAKAGRDSDSDLGIAWNGQVGVTFDFADDLKMDLSARYDMMSAPDYDLRNLGIYAGVRWGF